MLASTYTITVAGTALFDETDNPVVGFTITRTGNRSAQSATITLNNEPPGTYWASTFPSRAPLQIEVDGSEEFDGFVDSLGIGEGLPGQITVECAGRTMRLRDSEVRPTVYDDALASDKRDAAAVTVTVSGGQIQLTDTPIDSVTKVTVDGAPIFVLNADLDRGILYVDAAHNGATAQVSYTAFKAKYAAVAASTIATDLVARYGAAQGITATNVVAIATTLTFEPGRASNLFDELGRLRDFLGGGYDFYLDKDNDLHFFQRSGVSVATIRDTDPDLQSAQFSVDYTAYANKVTVRASEAVTNSIAPAIGPFRNQLEQSPANAVPTGINVSQAAQGFKALDSSLQSFRLQAKRQGDGDKIDWAVQYNGKTAAIRETFVASHSLTPDSTNIAIDAANHRIHVKAAAVGTAYLSSQWVVETGAASQSTGATTSTITGNIYQQVTVADLARKVVKGIAIKSTSTSGTVHLEIYSGTSGNTGTLLGTSESVAIGANDHEQETDWFAFYFADAVDVSSQTNISIVAVAESGTPNWIRSTANPYTGGQASTGANDDFTFQFFTVGSEADILAAVLRWTATATVPNREPLYHIARDYSIGDPDSAHWQQVLNNTPAIFTGAASAQGLFGVKIAFNSASLTTDPLVKTMQGDVAYLTADTALDQPSGITVGGLSGTIGSDVLPFFNQDTGTLTREISADPDTHLEPGGNYWLALYDGNATDDTTGVSYFTLFYDDGASATYVEDWDDSTAVGSSSNLTVADSEAAITRNKKVASFISTNLFTTTNAITDARIQTTDTLRGGKVFPVLSRNRRNYYNPNRSTDTAKGAAQTGEICILQFDSGDNATVSSNFSRVKDQSGNGFDALVRRSALVAGGKFGGGFQCNLASTTSQGIGSIAQWLMADASVAFWFKPTAALADGKALFYIGVAGLSRVNMLLRTKASGQVELLHTYNDGASTETNTTTGATVLVNGTWTHIAVVRTGYTSASIYFDGVLKNTFTFANQPDNVESHLTRGAVSGGGDLIISVGSGDAHGDPPTGILDEFRVWPRAIEDWLIPHVKEYPYTDPGAKFTFPAEADGTDDYTDTATAADGVKKNLRVAQFWWPSYAYGDSIWLRLPFNVGNSRSDTGALASTLTDLSSYAHAATAIGTLTAAGDLTLTGAQAGTQVDLDGSTEAFRFTNDDHLHFGQTWGLLSYVTQDATGLTQTLLHKRGEAKVTLQATSATLSTFTVTLNCPGGVTRTATFAGVSMGTAQKHVAITYDGQALRLYLNGTLAASNDFGSVLPVTQSTNDLYVGCGNPSGSTTDTFFDGKLDEVILLDYVASTADIAALDNDLSIGLRSPTQQGYTAAAYDGTGTKAYADGKYLVCRDGAAATTWLDTLDGSSSLPNGTLGFTMTFGKENVQAIARDEAEIARAGIEVGKVFDVAATDLATLQSIASGYLTMLKDGLAKGQVVLDGRTDLDVGDIVTIDYPDKSQSGVDYAIASLELTVAEGAFRTALGLGEQERAFATLFGKSEVGVLR